MNINITMLCGNLTRDPEVKFLDGDRAVAKFGLAINRTWKNANGEKQEEATFVDIEAWGKTAELVGKYLTKGSEAFIEGRLKLDTWEKDGQRMSKLKVVAESVQFGRRADGAKGGAPVAPRPAAAPAESAPASSDEPPF